MPVRILLLTPPFTQLNTPYPATAYLKGFLNTRAYESSQADLGISVMLRVFTRQQLATIFAEVDEETLAECSDNAYRIYQLRETYVSTIEPVIRFLQYYDPTLAHHICGRGFLPEANRFAELEDLDWAFGSLGIQDKARHLATLYLEDLGDFIREVIDPHFGFSRYAERLGRTATHFGPLQEAIEAPDGLISKLLGEELEKQLQAFQPTVVCLSVPFPGNVFGAFKCGQYLKTHYPDIQVVMGGGYVNTELRRLAAEEVFDFIDYICLDDGEAPLLHLLEYIAQPELGLNHLKRTYSRQGGVVCYHNAHTGLDIPQRETGTPDYTGLPLRDYLSVIELANPMHRLWSDGHWNKMTLAHGCYWGKCTFCDVSLDYIQRYEPLTASLLCDRMEEMIAQTGQTGFHFVDEAAPPALLRDLALEILRRKLVVSWWTNIRFEKSFTADLCKLLRASGCIAVSGGLEVASDRLLSYMKKGVTVAQVARVCQYFTDAGIMVHAYLMYGFPTQTAQETIDSLEMVRQLFQEGLVQSGFWHRFAMTAHSPVGLTPAAYQVTEIGPDFGGFADNDRWHDDPQGADHDSFAEGLRKSLFNYMHGVGFELALSEWFPMPVPIPTVSPSYITICLSDNELPKARPTHWVIWNGPLPEARLEAHEKEAPFAVLTFLQKQGEWELETSPEIGQWLVDILPALQPALEEMPLNFKELAEDFEAHVMLDLSFEEWLSSSEWAAMRAHGLWVV